MKHRTKPDLLRQNLTQYWKFSMFFHKSNRVGFNFTKFYTLWSLFNFYLIAGRPSHLKIRNTFIRRLWKKTTFRLDAVSNYIFINLRGIIWNNALLLFCNISSRTEIVPQKANTFAFTNLHFRNKKRLIRFNFTLYLYRKQYLSQTFFKTIFSKHWDYFKNNRLSQMKTKLVKLKMHFLVTTKKKHEIELNKTLKVLIRKKKDPLEKASWHADSQNIKTLALKTIHRWKSRIPKKIWKVWRVQKNTFHPKLLNFTLLRELKMHFSVSRLIYWNLCSLKKKQRKHKIFLFWKKIAKTLSKNEKINVFSIKRRKKQKILDRKKLFSTEFLAKTNTTAFWYTQFLLKFLKTKFKNFSQKINKNNRNDYLLVFQQEFSFPKSFSVLQIINKRMRIMTHFLRGNKKFYNNFLNTMPIIQTYKTTAIFVKQLAIELARTKKHWRVIRGAELLFLQSFVEMRKQPIKGKGGFFGFCLVIRGRPNKISRTRKVLFALGKIKKSEFCSSTVFQSFATSKAQIGSFGISALSATP